LLAFLALVTLIAKSVIEWRLKAAKASYQLANAIPGIAS
jgi:hypothetical protein